jgi:hypothetical protein
MLHVTKGAAWAILHALHQQWTVEVGLEVNDHSRAPQEHDPV